MFFSSLKSISCTPRIRTGRFLFLAAALSILGACAPKAHLSDLVDTSIGVTDKHSSNCVIGPMLPYGSINPSPQSAKGTSDGYKPTEPIRGFGQLHVSGTGWPTYGNFLISPMTGLSTGLLDHEATHTDLVTRPYLFAANLDNYGIKVEVTPAHYSAIYRFTFPASECSSIVFDAIHSIAGDIFPKAAKTVLDGESIIDPAHREVRMRVRMTGGWPEQPQELWCVARLSKSELTAFGSWTAEEYGSKERKGISTAAEGSFDLDALRTAFLERGVANGAAYAAPGRAQTDASQDSGNAAQAPGRAFEDLAYNYGNYQGMTEIHAIPGNNDHIGSYLSFATSEGEKVLLKIATSFVSYDQAAALLDAEIPDWDFDRVCRDARRIWDDKLSAIRVSEARNASATQADSALLDDLKFFYTSLYRVFTMAHERSLDRPGINIDARQVRRSYGAPGAFAQLLGKTGLSGRKTGPGYISAGTPDAAGAEIRPYWDDNYAYWDTFRTAYPMLVLLDEGAYRSNIEALIDRFEQRGGVWDSFVAGQDRKTDQGGNDVDHVIVDGFLKGVDGIDWERAYAIIKHDADYMRIGKAPEGGTDGANKAVDITAAAQKPSSLAKTDAVSGASLFGAKAGANASVKIYNHLLYKQLGWIPACTMSSSQTLEFAYNDWCAAQMARGLGHTEDADRWLERSKGWINLWNPDLESRGFKGWIDARNRDGSWVGVDPAKWGGSWVSPFYEGRSWTYSFYVPHDIPRLIELMGGPEAFVQRLEYGYDNRLTEYDNEPGFLTLRAFTEAGRPDLSSIWAHKLMDDSFSPAKGFPDNEDTGSMGSWYVWCAVGIFPNAGQDLYYLNAPKFKEIRLRVPRAEKGRNPKDICLRVPRAEKGRNPEASKAAASAPHRRRTHTLTIRCNAGAQNTVIKACTLDGRPVEGARLTHGDLLSARRMDMQLTAPEEE